MRSNVILRFLKLESSSSLILLTTTVIAMVWANSPFAYLHSRFVESFLFLINEGLMAIFFLIIGLELKRNYIDGTFSKPSQVLLPAFAALGGMLIPMLIYWLINRGDSFALQAWATPVATDIAFALGVLSLFGQRVPIGLKLFLLSLAIFDDLGAIIIIAFFYSHGFSFIWFFQSIIILFILYSFNVLSIRSILPYLILGMGLWMTLLRAGLHPTIAGVLLAFLLPDAPFQQDSPARKLETGLHPWVAYLIMPLFALANAGFSLTGLSFSLLKNGVVMGITLGLFVGKQIGVFFFSWILIFLRKASLPGETSFLALYGVAILCGIGFTMSLFLGTLSFTNGDIHLLEVRLGVLLGSMLSGLVGAIVLSFAFARKKRARY